MTTPTLEAELQKQLRAVDDLARRALSEGGAAQRATVTEMSHRAAAYAWIQQRVVLPAYRSRHWTQVRVDLLTASATFQRALADVLVAEHDAPGFREILETFAASVTALIATNDAALSIAMQAADIDQDQLALSEAREACGLDGHLSIRSLGAGPHALRTRSGI